MLKFIDITFYAHTDFTTVNQVLRKHNLVIQYARYLKGKMQVLFVKHAAFRGFHFEADHIFQFFKSINKFWYIPLKTTRFIGKQQPDVILVQGLGFPLQLMVLRVLCGNRCKIIAQHHGEQPFTGLKLWCQQVAACFTDAYFFTSAGNAESWRQAGVVNKTHMVFEVLEASTHFSPKNKVQSRAKLNIPEHENIFLWVGRLNIKKDPLTVLRAFRCHLVNHPDSKLYMIYQTDDLLEEINELLISCKKLKEAVCLIGHVAHKELPFWFSAADYYLSGSHKEGSGYALLEAMACGCIPIVTAIPPYCKITGEGRYGYLYPPGNTAGLCRQLAQVCKEQRITSAQVMQHFKNKLSFEQIAKDTYSAAQQLYTTKKRHYFSGYVLNRI